MLYIVNKHHPQNDICWQFLKTQDIYFISNELTQTHV